MNQLTLILAVIIVVAHSLVIFWPRKPLKVATDESGMPILWCNEDEQSRNVTCVWQTEENAAHLPMLAANRINLLPVTALNPTTQNFRTPSAANRRNAA